MKSTRPAQHAENTSSTPHVVGQEQPKLAAKLAIKNGPRRGPKRAEATPHWRPQLAAKIGSRQHSRRSKLAIKLSINSSVKNPAQFDFAQHFPFLGERNCGPNSRPRSTIWWILVGLCQNWVKLDFSIKVEVFFLFQEIKLMLR